MILKDLYQKAINFEFLSTEEGLFLFNNAHLSDIMFIANELRNQSQPKKIGKVGWIIDMNVNITNVCYSCCEFCNFYRRLSDNDIYITTLDEYKSKINTLKQFGGNQFLLQGGLHPKLGLDFYEQLFHDLKSEFPNILLHALGPPEIVHLSRMSKLDYRQVLERLIDAGLDSLPGAGAEILVDRVRGEISPHKCSTEQWLNVMRVAHQLNLPTSATMMFGHIETVEERINHLVALRLVQTEKPENALGFVTFVPWTFQGKDTVLAAKRNVQSVVNQREYIRMVALSRIMLPNIKNLQASWLTVGKETAQICLHAGANDLGSIMIEENVVSAAGANYSMGANELQQTIKDAGFEPVRRNQKYEFL